MKKRVLMGIATAVVVIAAYQTAQPRHIDQAAYVPLLNTIAKGESGGNYNAYFGNPSNGAVRFTDMSVSEVLQWQADHVKQGNISSAVGKYQIIEPTLSGLVDQLNIHKDEKFNEALQDRMAVALLERRGASDYMNDKLSREEFAANLAKEWAALPKVVGPDPSSSYYAADGVNKSNVTPQEMNAVLGSMQSSAKKK